jgi:hypothetical protein
MYSWEHSTEPYNEILNKIEEDRVESTMGVLLGECGLFGLFR